MNARAQQVMVAGAVGLTLALTAHPSQDAGGTASVTFSAVDLGAPAADRYIAVGIVSGGGGSGGFFGITIGGEAASFVAGTNSTNTDADIWIAHVPNGATGDIVLSCAIEQTNIGLGVWRMTGLTNAGVKTDSASATGVDPLNTTTLDIAAGGCAIAVASNTQNGPCYAWTGLTEAYDEQLASAGAQSGAGDTFVGAQTNINVKADQTSGTDACMVVASFR